MTQQKQPYKQLQILFQLPKINRLINNVYKIFFVWVFLICFAKIGLSQTENYCNNATDSAEIIKIVKNKGLLLLPEGYSLEEIIRYPSMAPSLKFNSQNCSWTVSSKTYKTTRKGKCKHTNGCTIEIEKTVVVSAITKKIISKKTTKRVVENYE